MRFSQLLAFVPLVGFVLAAPAADSAGLKVRDDLPTWVDRDTLRTDPKYKGIPVYEGISNEDAKSQGLQTRDETAPDVLFKRDDCNGSGACSSTSGGACLAALSGYSDSAYYCGYTSRVSNHCTAIFTCNSYHNTCWLGSGLKNQFNEIYTVVGCGICGSRYFDAEYAPNNCRATFNYCSSCKNVG
ncbi:hypothetical protein RUND412_009817 [Rhizina undulata]